MQEITQRGIAVLKAGDRPAARKLLEQAVQADPQDAVAWLWLSGAVDVDEQRIQCLRQVLRIEPDNQAAARGLEIVLAKTARQAPAAAAPQVEAAPQIEAAHAVEQSPQIEAALQIEPAPQIEAAPQEEAAPAVEPALQIEAAPQIEAPAAPVLSRVVPAYSRHAAQADEAPQVIFRTRSSLVPALGGFWLFFAGAYLLSVLVSGLGSDGAFFAAGIGLALELVVLGAAVRILLTRYELNTHYLLLRFGRRKTLAPVATLYHAEYSQTFFQKLLNTADIRVDGVVEGQLAQLCLKNVPGFLRRVEQIQAFTTSDD